MKQKRIASILPLFAVMIFLSISFVAANTFVVGIVTEEGTGLATKLADTQVAIVCGSSPKITDSLSDGAYAIGFNITECALNDTIKVSTVKAGYDAFTDEFVAETNAIPVNGDDVILLNIELTKTQTNGGNNGGNTGGNTGGSGTESPRGGGTAGFKYYSCGNNFCDAGETVELCPQDCSNVTEEENETDDEVDLDFGDLGEDSEETTTGLQRITGAAISLFKENTVSSIAVIILLALIGGAALVNFSKKKKPEEKPTKTVKKTPKSEPREEIEDLIE